MRCKNRLCSWILVFQVLIFAGSVKAQTSCDVASQQTAAPENTVIVSADLLESPDTHCRIEGYVRTENPGPTQVGFLLALPVEGWNGRFLFNSVGGAAGFLQSPEAKLIVDGFAVATTDGGHRVNSPLDWGDLKNPAKALDLSRRSIHVSAVAGQALTKAYYESKTLKRYIQGCSGGGQRALSSARYYPEDFDGYVIAAPGINSGNILAFAHITQYLARNPDAWIPPQKVQLLENTVRAACGAVDGVVPNTLDCLFDPQELQCKNDEEASCLTAKQLEAARLIAKGPGENIYPGAPYTDTTGWILFFLGGKPPPWTGDNIVNAPGGYLISHSFMRGYFGQNYDFVKEFNFNDPAHIEAYKDADRNAQMGQEDADLRGVEEAGGKIIFWHGMSDHGIVYKDMLRYYEELQATMPGRGRIDRFARLFAAPGVLHCGGGSGPSDMPQRALEKIISWVEAGISPKNIVAHRTDKNGKVREFLICSHPEVAVYDPQDQSNSDPMAALRGKAAYNANNWRCQ